MDNSLQAVHSHYSLKAVDQWEDYGQQPSGCSLPLQPKGCEPIWGYGQTAFRLFIFPLQPKGCGPMEGIMDNSLEAVHFPLRLINVVNQWGIMENSLQAVHSHYSLNAVNQ